MFGRQLEKNSFQILIKSEKVKNFFIKPMTMLCLWSHMQVLFLSLFLPFIWLNQQFSARRRYQAKVVPYCAICVQWETAHDRVNRLYNQPRDEFYWKNPFILFFLASSNKKHTDQGNGRPMAVNLTSDTKRLICLAILLGIYLLSGAVVFQVLENENDKLEIQELNSMKKFFLEKHNMTPDDFDFLVEKVENAVKHRCGGDPDQWCTSRWTYYASLYFTWSVVTTVGKVFLPFIIFAQKLDL